MKATTSGSTGPRVIPTRRISFEESLKELPKHFANDGDIISSHLMANLSGVFPDGEDFFVRSVRNFRGKVADPELKRQVAGFIGQEAVHGREHRMLNKRLHELGYDTPQMERMTRWGLKGREKIMSKTSNLAATAALEHFTATFAEIVLSDESARELMGEPEIRDVFVWHALEESEHKAVAFDVYKAAGGSERTRTATMNLITFGFISGMTIGTLLSLVADRDIYKKGNFRRSFRQFRKAPFLSKSVWRRLRDYNRADFHPDDHDTDELCEQWREELFGVNGRLNHMVNKKTAA